MKINKFVNRQVNLKNGKIKSGGAILINGGIRMSSGEGCELDNCHCSDEYWISIFEPLKVENPNDEFGGIVNGISVHFDDKEEFDKFIKNHEMLGL